MKLAYMLWVLGALYVLEAAFHGTTEIQRWRRGSCGLCGGGRGPRGWFHLPDCPLLQLKNQGGGSYGS